MSEIAKAIKEISKRGQPQEMYSLVATVTAVDTAERTCDVQPVNGDAEIFRVRLQAAINGDSGAVMIPTVGSEVVVTFLNEKTGYVALCSELDRVELVVDGITVELNGLGLRLASEQSDIKTEINALVDTLSGLVTTLQTFQVVTPAGPSTVATGSSLTDLMKYQADLNVIKANINTLLQ